MYEAAQGWSEEEAQQALDALVGRWGWRRFLLEAAEQAAADAERQESGATRAALRRTEAKLTDAMKDAPEQR